MTSFSRAAKSRFGTSVLLILGTGLLSVQVGCGSRMSADEPPAHSDPIAQVPANELYEQGVARAQRGDLGRAEQYIAAALSKGYPHGEALPMLLRLCVSANRYQHALRYARPYLQRYPGDWALRYLVASILVAMGHKDHAQEELREVLRAVPEEPGPHFLMAELMRATSESQAREHYERYLELAPNGRNSAAARAALDGLDQEEQEPVVRDVVRQGASAPGEPRRVDVSEILRTDSMPIQIPVDSSRLDEVP